jgi:hypothetical protein
MRLWLSVPLVVGCTGGLADYPGEGALDSSAPGVTGGYQLGDLAISAESIDFGTVAPGEEAIETLVLSNVGQEAVEVKQAALEGDYVFTVDTLNWPAPIEPGSDLILTLHFLPLQEATFSGNLSLSTTQVAETAKVALSGIGGTDGVTDPDTGDTPTEPPEDAFSVTPHSLSFGVVDVGTTATKELTITNNGVDDVLLVDLFGTDDTITYVSDATPPQVISSGSTKTVTVQYSPTGDGIVTNASFEIEMDPPELSASIPVTGEGLQTCAICNPVISVNTGGKSDTAITDFLSAFGMEDKRTVTVSNIGDMNLVIDKIRVVNDAVSTCGHFKVSGTTSGTLLPSGLLTFDVSYVASAICLEVASIPLDSNVIHIESNDPWTPDYVIALGGAGISF